MTTPKRPRYSNPSPSSRVSTSNPNYSTMDTLLESLITVVTDHASIDDSIDRIIDSKFTDSEQNDFIHRTIDVGSVLLKAGNRLRRKQASAHNAFVWPLPDDVTVKANDAVVSTMISRAGNALQSIKLGVLPYDERLRQRMGSSILTSSCLSSLNGNRGALGLRRLHLYNTGWRDNTALLSSLSICPSLIDLEIVCLDRRVRWTLTLESVSKHIPLIEHLIFESVGLSDFLADGYDGLEDSTCSEFVLNCPNITTLALKGFKVPDSMAHELLKGLHKLKYVDFSTSYSFTGSFLENLGTKGGGNNLEVMILRNTMDLQKVKVKQFMAALLAGDWRSLSHLDISHTNGLASKSYHVCRLYGTSSFSIKQLFEQRPNFHLVAEFGKSDIEEISSEGSLFTNITDSDTDSLSMSTLDGSSDESSDDSSDESLDEVDYHPV